MAVNTRKFINSIFKFLGKGVVETTGTYSEREQANNYNLSSDLHVNFFNNTEGQLESVLITKTKQDGSRTASLYIDYEQKMVRFTLDEEGAIFVYKLPDKPYYNLEMSIKSNFNSNNIMVVGYEQTDNTTIAPCKENHRAQLYKVKRGEMLTSTKYTRSEALKCILNDFTSTRTAKIFYKLLEQLGIEEMNRIDFLELLLNNKHGLPSIINSEYWAILSENYYEALNENEQGVGRINENHPSYTESDIEDIEAEKAVQLLGNIAKYFGINPSNLVWELGLDRRTNLPTYSINYNGLYIFAILTDNMDIYEIGISRYDQGSTSNDPDYSISVNFRFGAARLVIKNKSHTVLAKYSMLGDYSVTPRAIIGPVVKMNKSNISSVSGTQSLKIYRVGKQGPSGRLGMVDAREQSIGYLLSEKKYHFRESSEMLKPRKAREVFFNKITDQDTVQNLYITLCGLGIPNENIISFVRGIYGLFADSKRFNALFGETNGIINFEKALSNKVRSNMSVEHNPEISSFLVNLSDYLPIDKDAQWTCKAEKYNDYATYTTKSNGLDLSVVFSNATRRLLSITIKRLNSDTREPTTMISLKAREGSAYLDIANITEKVKNFFSYQICNRDIINVNEQLNRIDDESNQIRQTYSLYAAPAFRKDKLPNKCSSASWFVRKCSDPHTGRISSVVGLSKAQAYNELEKHITSSTTLKSLYVVLISLGVPNEKILDFIRGIYGSLEEPETLDRLLVGNAKECLLGRINAMVSKNQHGNGPIHTIRQITG